MRPHLQQLDIVPLHRVLQPQLVAHLEPGPPLAEPAPRTFHTCVSSISGSAIVDSSRPKSRRPPAGYLGEGARCYAVILPHHRPRVMPVITSTPLSVGSTGVPLWVTARIVTRWYTGRYSTGARLPQPPRRLAAPESRIAPAANPPHAHRRCRTHPVVLTACCVRGGLYLYLRIGVRPEPVSRSRMAMRRQILAKRAMVCYSFSIANFSACPRVGARTGATFVGIAASPKAAARTSRKLPRQADHS